MTKNVVRQKAHLYGADFLVNVIETHHRNPARKLTGLLNLLQAGHAVHVAQFSTDILYVDGQTAPWSVLDEWAKRIM